MVPKRGRGVYDWNWMEETAKTHNGVANALCASVTALPFVSISRVFVEDF
jgi:hypothetical protein